MVIIVKEKIAVGKTREDVNVVGMYNKVTTEISAGNLGDMQSWILIGNLRQVCVALVVVADSEEILKSNICRRGVLVWSSTMEYLLVDVGFWRSWSQLVI